jgi:GcrA cell cycle regulator
MIINPWTLEETKALKKLVEQKMTALEIARNLGRSRNAIMGRIHRLKLKLHGAVGPKGQGRKRKPKPERNIPYIPKKEPVVRSIDDPKPIIVVEIPKPVFTGKGVAFLQLTPRTCKYTLHGERYEDYIFCGEPTYKKSFCKHHHGLCYTKVQTNVAA